MPSRNKFPDLPSPDTVQKYKPDLVEFMAAVQEYEPELQKAVSRLPGQQLAEVDTGFGLLKECVHEDFVMPREELDDVRKLIVRDIHSLITTGKLTEVAEAA